MGRIQLAVPRRAFTRMKKPLRMILLCMILPFLAVNGLHLVSQPEPTIGVLTQEPSKSVQKLFPDAKSYVASSYIKFIESAGARAVPILIDQPDEYYEILGKSLNGVIFPGGGRSITSSSGYGRAGKKMYDIVIASGKTDNPLPLWATCLGFQMLMYLGKGSVRGKVLGECPARDYSIPLDLKDGAENSVLLKDAPSSVMEPLTKMNITSNFHKYCVFPETFDKYNLGEKFNVLSTNLDKEGNLEFISTVEHKELPIWGAQWHIEKNQFEWKYDSIAHTPEAIHVAQYFAQFFGDQARANANKFRYSTEERQHLIYNWNPTWMRPYYYSDKYWSPFHQIYLFYADDDYVPRKQ